MNSKQIALKKNFWHDFRIHIKKSAEKSAQHDERKPNCKKILHKFVIFLKGAPKSDFLRLVCETLYSESVEDFFAVRFPLIMLSNYNLFKIQVPKQ